MRWWRPSKVLLWTLGELALCLATVAATIPLYGRFFRDTSYVAPLAGAALTGAVMGAFAVGRARPFVFAAAPVALVLGLGYGLYPSTAGLGLPTPRMVRSVVDALFHGVPRMLTITIPADLGPDVLAVPIAVTALAAFAAATLSRNVRMPLAPLLPALLAMAAGLLLTATNAPPRTVLTTAWLLVALLVVLVRANRPARVVAHDAANPASGASHAVAQGFALGLPAIAAITAAAIVAAIALPIANSDKRFDPRSVKNPPIALTDHVSPLSYLKGQMLGTDADLFTVTFRGAGGHPPVDRVRLAAMDSYDGALWTIGGTFRMVGSTLPATGLAAPETHTMSIKESAQSPFGPFLPQVGDSVRLVGAAAALEPHTGVLLNRTSASGPLTFTSTGELTRPTTDQLTDARVDPTASDTLSTPPPAALITLAQQFASGNGNAMERLRLIEKYVRSLPYDPNGAPGHSYYSLLQLVDKKPGYAEQHAALFAVLARILGLPARVAVGYLLDDAHRTGDTYKITTRSAFAWPEVDLVGLGWVAFNPTDPTLVVHTTPPPPPPPPHNSGSQPRLTTGPARVDPNLRVPTHHHLSGWLLGLIVFGGLLVVSVGGTLLAKFLIRRERRAPGPPAGRIVGAWRAMLDTLRESGLPVSRSLTPLETAARTSDRFGDELAAPIWQFAPILSAALYAPFEPDADAAEQAWTLADNLARAARSRAPWWRAVLIEIDPRPLIRLPAGIVVPRWLSWLIIREGAST